MPAETMKPLASPAPSEIAPSTRRADDLPGREDDGEDSDGG